MSVSPGRPAGSDAGYAERSEAPIRSGVREGLNIETLVRCALSVLATATLLAASPSPTYSATPGFEQARMATAIANEIRDNGLGVFKTKNVELGQVAIERLWAIGNWRSVGGDIRGQVIFLYRCDSWNVHSVIAGAFSAQELAAQGVPAGKAAQLLAAPSESHREVAYTKIGQPGPGC